MMTGFTSNYVKVKVPYNKRYINRIVTVDMLSVEPSCEVVGRIVEDEE